MQMVDLTSAQPGLMLQAWSDLQQALGQAHNVGQESFSMSKHGRWRVCDLEATRHTIEPSADLHKDGCAPT